MNVSDAHYSEFLTHFGFLVDEFGFRVATYTEEPRAFDSFMATLVRDGFTIRVTRDRGQVFVDLSNDGESWHQKDLLLERVGVPWDRYPTEGGLWTGYDIANQAADLRRHLSSLHALLGA